MAAAPSKPIKAIARIDMKIPLKAGRMLQKTGISSAAQDNLAQIM
jgi:hypothetical protein